MHRPKPTSAENGRRSHGPITEAGRENARRAALKHGLAAKKLVLLHTESSEAFDASYQTFVNRFQPVDGVEANFVVDIAAANWRLGRACAMEKAVFTMNMQDAAYTEIGADMYLPVLDNTRFHILQVYIARIERSQQRAINNLIKIRRYFGPDEQIVEPDLELDIEPLPVDEIPPEPAAAEPDTSQPEPAPEPQASKKSPQPPPSAPQAPKTPQQPRKIVDSDPVAPPISPDDWPKAA